MGTHPIFESDFDCLTEMAKGKAKKKSTPEQNPPSEPLQLGRLIWSVLGVLAGCALAYHHVWYVYIQHENEMWFTNIKEVEREISFRTESGLYYSYFKQTVQAKSLGDAIHQFVHDNKTEFPNEVNILERFNIYQEIFLGIIYRVFRPSQVPILWYAYSVFNLQFLYSISLFATAWLLTDSWVPALLSQLYFSSLGMDMTRISFTIPLRESFALPFWAAQNAILTSYFSPGEKNNSLYTAVLALVSFLFAVCWQFNQFVFLLQACALYGTGALGLVPINKVKSVFAALLVALVFVYVSQFFNEMTIRALVVSFIPAAWITLTYRLRGPKDGVIAGFVKLALEIISTIGLAVCFQLVIKVFIKDQPDEHIFKFLMAKFGIAETDDFDAKLYLCNGAFNFLPTDTLPRLMGQGIGVLWLIVLVVGLLAIFVHCCQAWAIDAESGKPGVGCLAAFPALAYNIIHSFVFFTLALSTMRMKYLWTPHAAVLAACIALPAPWRRLNMNALRFAVVICAALLLYTQTWETYQTVITKESEFYDPDTVELMEWAAEQPKDTVFSGSMQLNAGVRLSSWRALTNHPHYEDKRLRETTFDVYQIYAHRSESEILALLGKYGTTHILVENSICYMAGRKEDNCATPDLLDLANGHLESDRKTTKTGLPPRFCDAIKTGGFTHFNLVLENRTFRVYKLVNNGEYEQVSRQKLIDYYY